MGWCGPFSRPSRLQPRTAGGERKMVIRVPSFWISRAGGDNTRSRIEILFAFIGLLYLCLVGRLIYLQAMRGDYFRREGAAARARKVILPSERGELQDSEGR